MSVIHLQTDPRSGNEDEAFCVSCSPCSPFLQELWRRVKMEVVVELPMLKSRWKQFLFGFAFQYVHGIFTQLEHRLHQPQKLPLRDLGFDALPELDDSKKWISETVFGFMFVSFLIWTFSPFVVARKRFYTAVLFSRLLMVLVVCQSLRIISFLSTQLPAPHYHCREGVPTAIREPARHWWDHIIIDPARQATGGCGDLIFSSHTTFILVGVLSYQTYGGILIAKILAWIAAAILCLLIVASRKHYSVDVIVAWYTVPLVFYTMHRRWTTHRDMRDDDSLKGELDTELELEVLIQDDSRSQLVTKETSPADPFNAAISKSGSDGRLQEMRKIETRRGDSPVFRAELDSSRPNRP